jgi:hypothetical protein
MGGTSWSTEFYEHRQQQRQKTGTSAFTYHSKVSQASLEDQKVHDLMNPLGVAVRESRDSEKHPESNAVIVGLDITGSMLEVPRILQKKLSNLMDTLGGGYLPHPQIMISAIGDARCDRAPCQVGQFESGIEIDDNLGRLWLEGHGGGNGGESYALAMYFYARHTAIDCFEKRGRKGYCFVIGDEMTHELEAREVQTVFGDSLEGQSLTTQDIIRELKEKYHLYFIIPTHTCHGKSPTVQNYWRGLVGPENVLLMGDEGAACELIAMQIGITEGTVDLDQAADDLLKAGSSAESVNSASAALGRVGRATRGNLRL